MASSIDDSEERTLLSTVSSSVDAADASLALALLMKRYKRLAYAIALEIGRDRTLADDIFQETFLRMSIWLRKRPGLEVDSFPRLMCAFVRRAALELRRVKISQEEFPPIYTSPLVDRIYAREIMAFLTEPARQIMELTVLHGLSSRETATQLGLSPENVRLLKHRAIRAIREQEARDLAVLEER